MFSSSRKVSLIGFFSHQFLSDNRIDERTKTRSVGPILFLTGDDIYDNKQCIMVVYKYFRVRVETFHCLVLLSESFFVIQIEVFYKISLESRKFFIFVYQRMDWRIFDRQTERNTKVDTWRSFLQSNYETAMRRDRLHHNTSLPEDTTPQRRADW